MANPEPEACMPCRGTGGVISNLGEESRRVACPWCAGSGERTPGVDAQTAWLQRDGDGAERPAASPDAAS